MLPRTLSAERIYISSEHPQAAWPRRVVRDAARTFVQALAPNAELSILLTTDEHIQALNAEHRQKNQPTDVLSFPQDPSIGFLGDVVISLDTARRQAQEGGRPLSDELVRLLAHGLLHLLGHDHETPDDAQRMAAAEVELLGHAGLVAEALGLPSELEFKRRRPAARRTSS